MTSDGEQSTRVATARSRELGEELRRVRVSAEKSSPVVAKALGWSLGKVSKLERGTRGTDTTDIATMLGLCEADARTRQRVLDICRETGGRSFVRLHDPNPDSLTALSVHERMARAVTSYEPLVIPPLAQIEEYGSALTHDPETVRLRLERQRLLSSRNVMNTFYVTEAALHRVIGDAGVMRDQLLHLALMCGWDRHVVRVIPATAHCSGILRAPATLLTFPEPDSPVVYVETDMATVFHDDPVVVPAYQLKLARFSRLALSAEKSRDLFARLADRYDRAADTLVSAGTV